MLSNAFRWNASNFLSVLHWKIKRKYTFSLLFFRANFKPSQSTMVIWYLWWAYLPKGKKISYVGAKSLKFSHSEIFSVNFPYHIRKLPHPFWGLSKRMVFFLFASFSVISENPQRYLFFPPVQHPPAFVQSREKNQRGIKSKRRHSKLGISTEIVFTPKS